mmetsp:Transcript_35726/g.112807  ORF Transcript_35726/g.112807 Transcript_35726/m.112807 type:complete len:186 (-) Transcript_35726:17-574(-)
MPGVDELASSIEILPGRFYFGSVRRPELLRHSAIATANICFSIDNELCYEPFFADFGPLNLGLSYRFCTRLEQYLQEAEAQNVRVYFWCGADPQRRANASVLVRHSPRPLAFGKLVLLWARIVADESPGSINPAKGTEIPRSSNLSSMYPTAAACRAQLERRRPLLYDMYVNVVESTGLGWGADK